MTACLACDLLNGERELVGGRVFETPGWVVEHCIGPLGVGTLLLKTRRHCLHVGELHADEAAELGPLLARTARCVQELGQADQVYTCLWSHAGWTAGHIHFVVQPVRDDWRDRFTNPGPSLQSEMFLAAQPLPRAEVEAFCERSRAWFIHAER